MTTPQEDSLRKEINNILNMPSYAEKDDLILSLLQAKINEAREAERKLIEREVWEAKRKEWAEYIDKIKNTPIEIYSQHEKYLSREAITDIQYAHPDLIRVIITPLHPTTEGGKDV